LLSRPAVQLEPNLTSQPPDGVNAHSRLSRAAVAVTRTGSGPSADTALGGTVSRDQARPFQVSATGVAPPVPLTGVVPPTAQVHDGIGAADVTPNICVECDATETLVETRHAGELLPVATGLAAAAGLAVEASAVAVSKSSADPAGALFMSTSASVANTA
jgi:hypothetical protein